METSRKEAIPHRHHPELQGSFPVNPTTKQTQTRYPEFRVCRFDKGFHSLVNQIVLAQKLERVVMPKKSRCDPQEQERGNHQEFRSSRRQHSAVKSGINALEAHGLDKCPDHGLKGFKRYVALAVVARNIQKLGSGLIINDRARERR